MLLPEIVTRASGISFAEFLRARVFEPLGMKMSTCVEDPAFVIPNRALAYEKQGNRWKMDMLLENDRGGAGALFTTASDLLIWNEALTAGRLGKFVTEKIQEPATLKNGRKLGYARGLMLASNYAGRLVHHGGSAAAYKSIVGRFVDQGVSVAVLCNAGEAADARDEYAGRIFDLFMADKGLGRPPSTAPAPASTGDAAVDVSRRAGLFFTERNGEALRLAAGGGRLAMAGGPAPLVTVTQDRFRSARATLSFMSQAEFELTFLSADQFELRTAEGEITRYRRAQPYVPTPEDLQAFAGRYDNDELRAMLLATAGKTGLMMQINDAQAPVPFTPVDRDTFQFSRITVRFLRDAAGKITGLDFTNPVLRNIRFTRVSAPSNGR